MGKVDPGRQEEATKYLVREGMSGKMLERMDAETLLFIDESKNTNHGIETKNYKWVTRRGFRLNYVSNTTVCKYTRMKRISTQS